MHNTNKFHRSGARGAYVPGELLLSALSTSKTNHEDFLGKSMSGLKNHEFPEHISNLNESAAFPFSERYKLLYKGDLELENGYAQHGDGTWFSACSTDIGECTGDMYKWWINNCDTSEKFKYTHPYHHISCNWDSAFHHEQSFNRGLTHYVGHTFCFTVLLTSEAFHGGQWDGNILKNQHQYRY